MEGFIGIIVGVFTIIVLAIIKSIYNYRIGSKMPNYKIIKVTDIRPNGKTVYRVQRRDVTSYYTIETFDSEKEARNFMLKYAENGNSFYKTEEL